MHGQISHPDPYAAVMQTMEDERVDEIIVSTFPGARSGWLRRDLLERLRADAKLPIEHVEVDVPVGGERLMAAIRTPSTSTTTSTSTRRSRTTRSRISPSMLGMFLFIGVGDHALRRVLHRVLLRARRQRHAVADAAVPPAGLRRVHQHAASS